MKKAPQNPGAPGDRHPLCQRLIEEKLRILRLLRALDRAGVDPEVDASVRVPLVRLSELDGLLTALLEVSEREDELLDADTEFLRSVQSLLPVSEAVRGDVLDALAPRLQKAVRRASSQVVANESEVLLEVDSFRRDAEREGKRGGPPAGPIDDAEAERIAKEMWTGEAPTARIRLDPRVRAQEAKALPAPEVPLRAWFDRTPRPWREVMARCHDIPRKGGGALAARLAERVSDPVWMRHYLTTRLGASEREMLARFLSAPVLVLPPDAEGMGGALHVSWDWAREFPASVGGKLRVAGLLHVGRDGDETLAIVPPTLLPMLRTLLQEVDPKSTALPERAMRQAAAELLKDAPFEDEELAHWKKIDIGLGQRFERWILSSKDGMRLAVDAFFQDNERTVHSQEDAAGLFEYGIFDWRATPDKLTLAEALICEESFDSPEERALAVTVAATLPALYRIDEVERGQSLLLMPLFPPGDSVRVADRSMSMSADLGLLLGLRVYPAGPFHFARLAAPPLEAHLEKALVRALRRRLRAFVRGGGSSDPATFLRERPYELLRLMREFQE